MDITFEWRMRDKTLGERPERPFARDAANGRG
jgi:hypothetical protein